MVDLLLSGHVGEAEEVVADRPQAGQDLGEGSDDEVLAMAETRQVPLKINILETMKIESMQVKGSWLGLHNNSLNTR